MTQSAAAAPYEALCELAEQELELLGAGRLDEVAPVDEQRTALIATLPAVPPAEARHALERCVLLERRVMVELVRARELVLVALAEVQHGQRAAHGYAPRPQRPASYSESA
jgi:hypothetical protein